MSRYDRTSYLPSAQEQESRRSRETKANRLRRIAKIIARYGLALSLFMGGVGVASAQETPDPNKPEGTTEQETQQPAYFTVTVEPGRSINLRPSASTSQAAVGLVSEGGTFVADQMRTDSATNITFYRLLNDPDLLDELEAANFGIDLDELPVDDVTEAWIGQVDGVSANTGEFLQPPAQDVETPEPVAAEEAPTDSPFSTPEDGTAPPVATEVGSAGGGDGEPVVVDSSMMTPEQSINQELLEQTEQSVIAELGEENIVSMEWLNEGRTIIEVTNEAGETLRLAGLQPVLHVVTKDFSEMAPEGVRNFEVNNAETANLVFNFPGYTAPFEFTVGQALQIQCAQATGAASIVSGSDEDGRKATADEIWQLVTSPATPDQTFNMGGETAANDFGNVSTDRTKPMVMVWDGKLPQSALGREWRNIFGTVFLMEQTDSGVVLFRQGKIAEVYSEANNPDPRFFGRNEAMNYESWLGQLSTKGVDLHNMTAADTFIGFDNVGFDFDTGFYLTDGDNRSFLFASNQARERMATLKDSGYEGWEQYSIFVPIEHRTELASN